MADRPNPTPVSKSPLPKARLRRLRSNLLRWYDREQRALPWRTRPSPYRTAVSEFMLQQTQVATVVPYFRRFVRRFPSFRALNRATEEEVLAAWSGLGYYRRARSLKRAADAIVDEHRGRLPKEIEQLRALPGFGDYTTAAVGSIALDLPVAAVDGNVRRVTARLFAVSSREGQQRLADLAAALLDRRRPGDWNQAMMELGATLCTPRRPRCPVCPLRRYCAARELGEVESYPEPRAQPRTQRVDEVVVAVIRRGALLVLQRGDEGSFSRMWELPRMDTREVGGRDLIPERVLAERTGLDAASFTPMGRTESTFTHHRIRTRLYRAESPTPGRIRRRGHVAHRWVKARDMKTLAASGAQKRLFALLQNSL